MTNLPKQIGHRLCASTTVWSFSRTKMVRLRAKLEADSKIADDFAGSCPAGQLQWQNAKHFGYKASSHCTI
jgi:hypothetical protein